MDRSRLLLYVIPDSRGGRLSLVEQARLALEGGATALQLRHKEASSRQLYDEALVFRKLCDRHGALFIVNDRLDVALAAGADGVHLGADDLPLVAARRLVPEGFVIGASARTVRGAREAQEEGADYLGVGAVFPTGTKEDAVVIGPEGFEAVCRSVTIPSVAIGGITERDLSGLLRAGAAGVAVVSAVVAADDPRRAARRLLESLARIAPKLP
ncbi:MAG: thiamine phosphate synthase [Synergistaceae bacterium]|nr:thiamine phosphate synthase [Synergistaceae bacterium]